MKKFFLLLIVSVCISISISSCKKCGHCVLNGVDNDTYCEKDNQSVYDIEKSACANAGGSWENN